MMNSNENNYSWREWSKYVLLTLERFEKLIENLRTDITCLKEEVKTLKSDIAFLQEDLDKKASKSDLKFIEYKLAVITAAITFVATLFATYVFKLITGIKV